MKPGLSHVGLLLASVGLLICSAGCAGRRMPIAYIDVERVAKIRSEWTAVERFDQQSQALDGAQRPLAAWAGSDAIVNGLRFPAQSAASLTANRQIAQAAIRAHSEAVTEQMVRAALLAIEAQKPSIDAKYIDRLRHLEEQQAEAFGADVRTIVERYGALRYSLSQDRAALDRRRDYLTPLPNIAEQMLLIDNRRSNYSERMHLDVESLRSQRFDVLAAARRQYQQEAAVEYSVKLANARTEVLLQIEQAGEPTLSLPDLTSQEARSVNAIHLRIPPFHPPDHYPRLKVAVQTGAVQSRDQWRAFVLRDTKEAARDWCRRHGYALARREAGAQNMTARFVREWNAQ